MSTAVKSGPGDDLDQVWERLTGLHARVEQELGKMLRRTGLGLSEYRALAHLATAPEAEIRMLDLADVLALNQSSISRLVARLESSSFVHRATCGDDRRGVFVVINENGRAVLDAAAPTYREALSNALAREVGAAQLLALRQALTKHS